MHRKLKLSEFDYVNDPIYIHATVMISYIIFLLRVNSVQRQKRGRVFHNEIEITIACLYVESM